MIVQPLLLLVDDDISVRRALGRLLRSAGFDVETFATAGEFLAYERPAGPACLVLDVHLTDTSGLDLLKQLRETDPDLPVVILTGDMALKKQALQEGAKAFLVKPVDSARLLEVVRQLLDPDP